MKVGIKGGGGELRTRTLAEQDSSEYRAGTKDKHWPSTEEQVYGPCCCLMSLSSELSKTQEGLDTSVHVNLI